MNRAYEGLRTQLVWPFVLLGYVVSAILSLTAFTMVSALEERAIERALHAEFESFSHRRQLNPEALPPSGTLLYGVALPSADLPPIISPGLSEPWTDRVTLNDRRYSVMAAEIEGAPYALLYDRTSVDSSLAGFALFLMVATGLMTLLSYVVGNRLARKLVRPVGKLIQDISTKAANPAADPYPGPLAFSANDYPNNEIGDLVRSIDDFTRRLHGFMQREHFFAADVSHELRTPVAVIRGAAEVLEIQPDLSPRARQRVATIHRQAIRMGELLEAMLLLAREEDYSTSPICPIADVIKDVIDDCRPSLEQRPVVLQSEIRANPQLPVERSLAYVAISNLVRNACNYTREGTITVSLENDRLSVADTGIGIAEDRFPTLFERHTKGAESSGNGLGLSIVARVADRLRWQVRIDKVCGSTQGTCISLCFPAER